MAGKTSVKNPGKTSLYVVQPAQGIDSEPKILEYRFKLLQIAENAIEKLHLGGYFVVGVQDVRLPGIFCFALSCF